MTRPVEKPNAISLPRRPSGSYTRAGRGARAPPPSPHATRPPLPFTSAAGFVITVRTPHPIYFDHVTRRTSTTRRGFHRIATKIENNFLTSPTSI
ncbi:hypothetical protein EVAR_76279_1 [Eumeta japonica]|uniref:Uncharacterized protein n=1 Tax=Eumeta variegata TaxID=151549 RepID=A0A4C1UQR4_EUMVA|nr:hypothetical protein EVAR_76279_1 [Eumeta japonica]